MFRNVATNSLASLIASLRVAPPHAKEHADFDFQPPASDLIRNQRTLPRFISAA